MWPLLSEIYKTLFTPRYRYRDTINQGRARLTLQFGILVMISGLVLLVSVPLQGNGSPLLRGIATGALLTLVFQALVIALIHLGTLRLATALQFLLFLGSASAALVGGIGSSVVVVAILPILYASSIWGAGGTLFSALVVLLEIVVAGLYPLDTTAPSAVNQQIITQTVQAAVTFAFLSLVIGLLSFESRRQTRLANRLLAQQRATAEIAAQASAHLVNLDDMLKQTARYVQDRFAFYRVQIYLTDDEHRYATLAVSTDDAGATLAQRGYRLSLGSPSAVSQALLRGEPVTSDKGSDTISTASAGAKGEVRSELALPLTVGDAIIGALAVQSARSGAFSDDDATSLALVAAHLGIAIRTAQIFDKQQTAASESRRAYLEAETSLREVERLNERLTGQAWESYIHSYSGDTFGFTLSNSEIKPDSSWTPALQEAAEKHRAVIGSNGDRQMIAVPVELRGRPIGAIEVELRSGMRQADALEIIQSVSQRLALSIDNARLFEQAQQLAQQELEVNAISARIQGMNNMDDIMETTLSELGRALGASQAAIRLGEGTAR